MTLEVRTAGDSAAFAPTAREIVRSVDPNLSMFRVRTQEQQIAASVSRERLFATLATWLGGVALTLSAIGLYALLAYMVTLRTGEIGIRMALGADRGHVLALVLRSAFRRVLVGLVIGLPLAVGAGYLLSSQLYGVKFWDPLALSVAAAALGGSAFLAAMIPASRAASISPIQALRAR